MEVQRITRRSLLYKSGVEYADYALNHVEGCSHGCTYPCYAMMMKKRCGSVRSYGDWIQPKIVENALELLDRELPRMSARIDSVYLCFSTDPFMYGIEEVHELTLEILRRLAAYEVKAVLITKGEYLDVLVQGNGFGAENEYGVTIVSLSEEFRKRYEPNAAPIVKRIDSLRKLHLAGLRTWVSIEPFPTPNIIQEDLAELLQEISFVDRIVFGRWNYSRLANSCIDHPVYYNSLAAHVIKFGVENVIKVHVKKDVISSGRLEENEPEDQEVLEEYLAVDSAIPLGAL